MTSNITIALGGGAIPLVQSPSVTIDTLGLLVWPSLVLALASTAIAVVGINAAATNGNKSSPFHRNEQLVGRSLLAQVGLLICVTILHASSIFAAAGAAESSSAGDATDGTAVSPDPREAFEVLIASVYLTTFVNILCSLVVSLVGLNGSSTTKYRYCHPSTDAMMRSFSIANLGPMIYSILLVAESQGNASIMYLHNYNRWHMMMVSYAVSLLIVQSVQRLMKNRRKHRNVLVGIPLVNGYRYADESEASSTTRTPPRPDRWYEWSPEEVARWVSTLPPLGCSGSPVGYNNGISASGGASKSSGTNERYASLLQEECVHGAALVGISIDALRSLGLPYGHAAALRRGVDENLIARYGTGDLHLREEALQYHNGASFGPNFFEELGGSSRRGGDGATVDSVDPKMAEKAGELFAERFGGMQLANFQTTGEISSGSQNGQHEIVAGTITCTRLGTVDEESAAAMVEEEDDSGLSPAPPALAPLGKAEALLSSMPPHVREAAMRNPDLVRTMLLQNRRTVGMVGGAEATNGNAGAASGRSRSASEVEMPSHWGDDYDDEEEEEEEGSDTVGLLRRRPNR